MHSIVCLSVCLCRIVKLTFVPRCASPVDVARPVTAPSPRILHFFIASQTDDNNNNDGDNSRDCDTQTSSTHNHYPPTPPSLPLKDRLFHPHRVTCVFSLWSGNINSIRLPLLSFSLRIGINTIPINQYRLSISGPTLHLSHPPTHKHKMRRRIM